MKLFVVLALLGLCSMAYGRDFCAETDGRSGAEVAMAGFNAILPRIITRDNCPTAAKLIADHVFWHDSCLEAFSQGYCFATDVYAKFGPEEGDTCIDHSKGIDTYIEMAKFATNYVGPIGQHGCDSALPCFKAAVATITECSDNNPMFFESVVANAFKEIKAQLASKPELEKQFNDLMGVAEEMFNCDFGDDADAQCLLAYVKSEAKTLTLESIQESIETFIGSAKEEEEKVADARTGLNYFMSNSSKFCSAGCVSKSTSFFTHMFVGTDCEESCPSIDKYCGGCEANANKFLDWYPKSTPCCTRTALKNIMAAFNYVKNTYGDDILDLQEEGKAYLRAKCPGAVTRYADYVTAATEQAQCVNNTYEKIKTGCCSKCHPKCQNMKA